MKRKKQLGLAFAAAAVCISGCGNSTDQAAATTAIAVKVNTVLPQTMEQYISVSSRVSSENEVQVFPKASGTVTAVFVSLGDKVEAGDVLFEIDSQNAALQVRQAEAGLQMAQANYSAAVGGSLEIQLQQMQAAVDSYEIQYKDVSKMLENTKILYQEEIVSQKELDDMQSKADTLKLQLETAKKELELNQSKIQEESRISSQAAVNQARVALESAQKALGDTSVKAEIGGIVGNLNVTVGSTASMQSPAMTISDMDRIKTVFPIPENAINRISEGSKVYIGISSVSEKPFETTVSHVSATTDSQTSLYTAEAYLENLDGAIKPGMFADIRVVLEQNTDAISVPLNAVIEKNGETFVYTIDGDSAVKTPVETGLKNDERVELTKGVKAGDKVVIKGQDFLSDGSLVTIIEA